MPATTSTVDKSSVSSQDDQNLHSSNKHYTVVKRNGMIVPFRHERIFNAIEGAFRDTKNVPQEDPLPKEYYSAVKEVCRRVVSQAQSLANHNETLTVEGIQDIVEKKLMDCGHHDVARNYIVYRDQHKMKRELTENLKVIRHDKKTIARFKPIKISSALEKAFRTVLNVDGNSSQDLISSVNLLTNKIIMEIREQAHGQPIDSELIQDTMEKILMAEGFFDVAKFMILNKGQKLPTKEITPGPVKTFKAKTFKSPKPKEPFAIETYLKDTITYACKSVNMDKQAQELIDQALVQCYEGISENEAHSAAIIAVKERVELEPIYAKIASRLLLDKVYREVLEVKGADEQLVEAHKEYFIHYMSQATDKDNRLNDKLASYDLEKLANALDLSRDCQFSYLGLQTLYDRYFIHKDQRRLETPQIFWMRVAMGLAYNEGSKKDDAAIEFYRVLSSFDFVSSTPTLFNSGTNHPQLSSCYLSTVADDLHHIYKLIADNAQLSKWAGGIGNDWTPIRATGSLIKGTNGHSQGVIPFLKVVNDTAVAVNQGGKRKGAACTYLETWHLDIEDFLELRKNTGDDRRRTHDMNTANWIPDLFMKRVRSQGKWTLFSPIDTPDLHDLYGKAFEKRYEEYEKLAKEGKIKNFKEVDAQLLWRKMLSMLFETGHPWITFKDPSNIRSPQDHKGVVHSSNLCTEILLNTSLEETAVCNLGSINLAAHVTDKGLDEKKLAKTIRTAIRMLDNVVDINFYPILEAETSNKRHRPIGLGIMGFQDALYIQDISYASEKAVEFADKSMEMISYYAILASSELAKEKGAYSSYKGSKWDRGILPIDSLKLLVEARGSDIEVDTSSSMDWEKVRQHIEIYGMRNSNTMAIAPTATIANIIDVTASIEPTYKHLFVKSNLSGEFTIVNPYLIKRLKQLNLWDEEMIDDLKYFDGSLTEIDRVPQEIKNVFLTAFEIEPEWIIECASRRQKWIDMGQSLNLYLSEPSGKKLHNMYMLAWEKGLKTTYYLRTLGATQIEKSSSDINKRGLQPRWMKNTSASSEVQVQREKPQTPTVCNLEEGCESCQ